MPSVTAPRLAEALRPYVFHGMQLVQRPGMKEATGTCPFCDREGKFSVNIETGQWRCFTCGGGKENGGGSHYDFMKLLWEASEKATQTHEYNEFAKNRTLEFPETLIHWGVCKSILTGNWIVPGWNMNEHKKLQFRQLYQYVSRCDPKHPNSMMLMPTPLCKHCLLGLQHYDPDKPDIFSPEGPWDCMRMWEVLRTMKQDTEGAFELTANVDYSLFAGTNILAVPTCSSFNKDWAAWFAGKNVWWMFDSDHPQLNAKTGQYQPSSGYMGMKRAAARVGGVAGEQYYLKWGEDGYDKDLPHGYDLRDIFNSKTKAEGLQFIFNRNAPIPTEWVSEPVAEDQIQCKNCNNWTQVVTAWRKALKWTTGLDQALAVMLASVASTSAIGDQLWVKIVGPPSTGKSSLCEALSINKKWVVPISTVRGFHSGYKAPGSTKDNSLIPIIAGKTLITKDGDTMLQAPNKAQIFSEARDLYDRVSRAHYRTGQQKSYEGISLTWILCGTNALREIDRSELGARFLDCIIMEPTWLLTKEGRELEDDILWLAVNRAKEHVAMEYNGEVTSQHSPEMLEAMQLTGGYVSWLRENAQKMLSNIKCEEGALRECLNLGKFVAYMRARPAEDKRSSEKAERELAARLASTHTRLAMCLALVLNRSEVDAVVMARVKRVAMDTARGVVLDIARKLYATAAHGMERQALGYHINTSNAELDSLLRFMRDIGVAELVDTGNNRMAWRLQQPFYALYQRVMQ